MTAVPGGSVRQGEGDVTAHEQQPGSSTATGQLAARRCRFLAQPLPDWFRPC